MSRSRRLASLKAEHAPDDRLEAWDVEIESDGRSERLVGATTSLAGRDALLTFAEESGLEAEIVQLPDPALGDAVRGISHRAVAHLRKAPSHASELVSQLLLGEEALVLRARDEWLQVRTGDPYIAWVHEGSLVRRVPDDPGDFHRRLAARRPAPGAWVVVARDVVARREADPGSPPVAVLVQGGRVSPEGTRDTALRIVLPDGTGGWIPSGSAVPLERLAEVFPPEGSAVLAHAEQFLGLPYLWGGTSEKGFDCSGFVQRIWELHGVPLPRDSDQQSRVGEAVDPDGWSEVSDGDLAFFADRSGRVVHVGFLARGGRLLHASTTRHGVAWDVLDPGAEGYSDFGEWLRSRLIRIRRVRED